MKERNIEPGTPIIDKKYSIVVDKKGPFLVYGRPPCLLYTSDAADE